jgi:DNA repair protein RadC
MASISNANGGQTAKSLHRKRTAAANRTIQAALRILKEELTPYGPALNSPQAVREYLQLKIGPLEHEVFMAFWLDAMNHVIEIEQMFRGTITMTSVYPREIVKSALRHNAAGVIFSHNHPSGSLEPSGADQALTRTLKQALSLVDVNVLDHFIIGAGLTASFAELGLL